jgi:hypothetical protein
VDSTLWGARLLWRMNTAVRFPLFERICLLPSSRVVPSVQFSAVSQQWVAQSERCCGGAVDAARNITTWWVYSRRYPDHLKTPTVTAERCAAIEHQAGVGMHVPLGGRLQFRGPRLQRARAREAQRRSLSSKAARRRRGFTSPLLLIPCSRRSR